MADEKRERLPALPWPLDPLPWSKEGVEKKKHDDELRRTRQEEPN